MRTKIVSIFTAAVLGLSGVGLTGCDPFQPTNQEQEDDGIEIDIDVDKPKVKPKPVKPPRRR